MANQIAEQSGHGVPTIVAKYGKESFDFSSDAILVTIKFAFSFRHVEINENFGFDEQVTIKKATKENENTTKEVLKGSMKEIYDLICCNSNITIKEISEKMPDITSDGVKYNVNRLKSMGYIRHDGSTKSGKWIILK